jgi:lincosamide nucleotidyltransferase A/C/D/E
MDFPGGTVLAIDALRIYQSLFDKGIPIWLCGGWGIDALLEKQTRLHHDLDVLVLLDDIDAVCEILAHEGYNAKDLWSENRQAIDARGNEVATAFFLTDSQGREFDVHAIRLDEQGNGHPVWEEHENFIFSRRDLTCEGKIAGAAVHCLSPEMQVLFHTGYELPDKQIDDLERLHQKFGIQYPEEYFRRRPPKA